MERTNTPLLVILTAILGLLCGGLGYAAADSAAQFVAGEVNTITQDVQTERDYLATIEAFVVSENDLQEMHAAHIDEVRGNANIVLDGEWLVSFSDVSEQIIANRNTFAAVVPPERYEGYHQRFVSELEFCNDAENEFKRALQFLDVPALERSSAQLDECTNRLNALLPPTPD